MKWKYAKALTKLEKRWYHCPFGDTVHETRALLRDHLIHAHSDDEAKEQLQDASPLEII